MECPTSVELAANTFAHERPTFWNTNASFVGEGVRRQFLGRRPPGDKSAPRRYEEVVSEPPCQLRGSVRTDLARMQDCLT